MTEMCVSDEQQITSDGLTLDLTNAHLPSLLSVPLPASLTDLDLTANRLTTLEPSLLALPGTGVRMHAAPLHDITTSGVYLTHALAFQNVQVHTD